MDKIKDAILYVENLKVDNKIDEAINFLEKEIAKESNDYRLYEELADIYLFKWNNKKALISVDFALELNKDSATWNYLKWFILLSRNNKIIDAILYLERSNILMPNNAEVLRNLWWAYTLKWEIDRWIMVLKRALVISPDDYLITEDLAMALISIWEINEWNYLLEKIGKNLIK